MTATDAIALFQHTIMLALMLAAPMLLFGLVAGLVVSIFQAVTQVHEMTLTFIPKNAKDIHLIEQGMRAKMGLATDVATEATAANATDADRDASGVYTTLGNPTKDSTLGLDRFFKANAGTTVTTADSQYTALRSALLSRGYLLLDCMQ